jgi:FkbM family methyltransferase
MITRFIKKIVPYSTKVRLRERVLGLYGIPFSRFDIAAPLIQLFRDGGPINLIDIGASSGNFTDSMEKFCGIKRAILVEPIPKRCAELKARFSSDRFKIISGAVSNKEGEFTMEILNWDYSSSILPVMRSDTNISSEIDLGVAETITTRMLTLDGICAEHYFDGPVDLLKVDVQGAEHLVLEGAKAMLPQVKAIWLEVSFRPLYEGSLTFEGILARCRESGFVLASLAEGFRGANGELLQADALFVRPSGKNPDNSKLKN